MNLEILAAETAEILIMAQRRAESDGDQLSVEHILLEMTNDDRSHTIVGRAIRDVCDVTRLGRTLRLAINQQASLRAQQMVIMEWTSRETRTLNHLDGGPEHLLLGLLSGCERALRRYWSREEMADIRKYIRQLNPPYPVSPYVLLERFSSHPAVKDKIERREILFKQKADACLRGDYSLARQCVREGTECQRALGELILKLAADGN